jgi:hypothetical protein
MQIKKTLIRIKLEIREQKRRETAVPGDTYVVGQDRTG